MHMTPKPHKPDWRIVTMSTVRRTTNGHLKTGQVLYQCRKCPRTRWGK